MKLKWDKLAPWLVGLVIALGLMAVTLCGSCVGPVSGTKRWVEDVAEKADKRDAGARWERGMIAYAKHYKEVAAALGILGGAVAGWKLKGRKHGNAARTRVA